MFCYNCGKEIDDDSLFCPFCGVEQTYDAEEGFEEEPAFVDEGPLAMSAQPEEDLSGNFLTKKPIVTIAALACVIIACLIGAGIVFFGMDDPDTKGAMEADNIVLLDCDADWDSSYKDEQYGTRKVDVIMLVKNDSDKDIASLEFNLKDKSGNPVENALDAEKPFRAEGFIAKNTTGIMVATVWTNEKKKIVPENSFEMLQAYEYLGEEGYVVPTGTITAAKGVNHDFYSVSMNNPNSVDISDTATYVAVDVADNNIKDSDATGRIGETIAADSKGNHFDNVFRDPGLNDSIKDYVVYAIDSANYR